MSNPRMRDRIARLAAQMMYERQETEYFNAKRKAAQRLGYGRWIPAPRRCTAETHERSALRRGARPAGGPASGEGFPSGGLCLRQR